MTDPVPLIVDLDGTLIAADSLKLSLILLAQRRPWVVPMLPFVVLRGRARFKAYVSDRVSLDPRSLPYREDVLAFVTREHAARRRIILGTAATRRIAEGVAEHLDLFDSVIASDSHRNAKGDGKLSAIRDHLGDAPFDYIGDSMDDVPVFRSARRSYLVCPEPALVAAVRDGCRVAGVFDGKMGPAALS